MSLNDKVKDMDLNLLREGSRVDPSLKLNSSWHLSGSGYVSKEYMQPRHDGLSLDSSHSSSQASYLDMFPDTTADSMSETKRQHTMLSMSRGDNVESSYDSTSTTARFYVATTDSPVLGESASTAFVTDAVVTDRVFLAEDSRNSALDSKPGCLSEDLTKSKFSLDNLKNRESFAEFITEQSAEKQEGNVRLGLNISTASEELLSSNAPSSVTDSQSSSPSVFVFPDTVNLPSPLSAEQFATEFTSQSSKLQSLSSQLQSPEKSPQTQASAHRKGTPLKSKPTDLVIATPKLRQSAETSTKSPLPSLAVQTPEQPNTHSEGTPTPDDGYSSSLNSAKLASHGSLLRSFELLPSRLEKNFQNYGTQTSQSKHDDSLNVSRVSGDMQSSTYACLSKLPNRTELGTPTGIVNRLKSEITLRELSQQIQSPGPLSTNKEFSKEMLRSSLSQSCKGGISKSFSRSKSSPLPPPDHSQAAERKDDKACREDPTGISPETPRSVSFSTGSRQSYARQVVSDPGYTRSFQSLEPSSNSQAELRETQKCKTQLDLKSQPADKNNKYSSINFELATHSRTSAPGASAGKCDAQASRTSLKTPLVKCASLPLKSLTPSPTSEKVPPTPMDYQVLEKSALQSSENTPTVRRTSPPKDLRLGLSPADNVPTNRKTRECVEDIPSPKELDSPIDDTQKRTTKRRLCHSEPKFVTSNSSEHEIERTRSDISGIASKTTEPDEERLNEANKENLGKCQLLKRNSGVDQSSTPEKLSKRSKESVSSAVETVDDDTAPKSPDIQKMSVKNRGWHKELLEEYMNPTPSPATTSSSSSQTNTATKKPNQRLAVLGPKISFTPMPIQAYQSSSSKLSKAADKLRKP